MIQHLCWHPTGPTKERTKAVISYVDTIVFKLIPAPSHYSCSSIYYTHMCPMHQFIHVPENILLVFMIEKHNLESGGMGEQGGGGAGEQRGGGVGEQRDGGVGEQRGGGV